MKADLSRLYKGIDLPETLSNLTGKRKRQHTEYSMKHTGNEGEWLRR